MNTVTSSFKIPLAIVLLAGGVNTYAAPKPQAPSPRHETRSSRKVGNPGHQVPFVPRGAISLSYGNGQLFFHAGVFLKWNIDGYVVVEAPVGILVPTLPVDCQVEVVSGQTYYVIGNTYYRKSRGGYVVVNQPVAEVVTVVKSAPKTVTKQTVTVWLENPNGSKTPVKLVPADDGQWIGPKGEYYETFPTESQLEPVYGLPGGANVEAKTASPSVHTLWIENTNGSKTPVELKQNEEGKWVGPNDEVYDSLPTESDLRESYGL